ncbi:MAG: acyl-CoA desaturase [Vicingaceae bacterium]|nr:acyl-CoA desaturase [Vicingaceae bacterium]
MTEGSMTKAQPKFQKEGEFAKTLKQRVNNYFKENNVSKNCNTEMVIKTIFYLSLLFLIYFTILFGPFTGWSLLGLAFLLGSMCGLVGFNVGHDAIHGGYSSKKWVNNLLGQTFTAFGAYAPNWAFTHNMCHHTFTSIPDADGDYTPAPILRFHEGTAWKPIHKYQHIYVWFLYSIFTIEWVLVRDLKQLKKKKHLIYQKPPLKKGAMTKLVIAKIIYYANVFLWPALLLDVPWWGIPVGFLVMQAGLGLTLSLVFQLGHMVEDMPKDWPDKNGVLSQSYTEHQCATAVNFASTSWFGSWMTGGLNTQIEHHLFPNICSIHYRKIAPIVKQTAKEYGVHYREYTSWPKTVASHYRLLKSLGCNTDIKSSVFI